MAMEATVTPMNINNAVDDIVIAHKFGGSSLADSARMKHVIDVLRSRTGEAQVVVVSAMQGVTDALIRAAHAAAARDSDWVEQCIALERRHLDTAHELLGLDAKTTTEKLENQFAYLRDLLHALNLLGTPSAESLAYIQGMGEVLSAILISDYWRSLGTDVGFLDAREVLVVTHEELGAVVAWEESATKLALWRDKNSHKHVVITGFIARDLKGCITTLGRNGSDYSGAIFGALFNAAQIHIWTDVDGVLSADPRLVPEAILVPELTYAEACELAYFGAKVIHPQTMQPAIARNIPLRIRNTFKPEHEGSLISSRAAKLPPVKGTTAISQLALISVEGAGMMGVPGTAERVFAALHKASISVVMISQGSSEHSICCVVEMHHAQKATDVLCDAFEREMARGQIQRVVAELDVSVLAVVGEGMAGTPGIAARLFEALSRSRINVRAIAQGASELNISVAIASADSARALRAVHARFYLSPQTVSVGVIGPGSVGGTLLDQIAQTQTRLLSDHKLDIRVRAIASSQFLLRDEQSLNLKSWRSQWSGANEKIDWDVFTQHVSASHLPHAVIIDCSASSHVAERYAQWIAQGIHVITPNKQAGSGAFQRYQSIRRASSQRGAQFRFEATVGAGLPIMSTLRDLIDTGDEIVSIEGILSGTLAWLFNRFDGSQPFSVLVKEAHAAGYTEPDPRDDLSGTDVARKLVILGREMGLNLELESVRVEGLVSDELKAMPRELFLQNLSLLDAPMQDRLSVAKSHSAVLRYVARLDRSGTAHVGVAELAHDHPFAHGRGTDNIVQFSSRRYCNNPLVVQGPGAGPEVTAAGIFADLLRVTTGLVSWT